MKGVAVACFMDSGKIWLEDCRGVARVKVDDGGEEFLGELGFSAEVFMDEEEGITVAEVVGPVVGLKGGIDAFFEFFGKSTDVFPFCVVRMVGAKASASV